MAYIVQKSYAHNRKKGLEFDVGEWVYLKISLMKGVISFVKKGKLSPRYLGPYKILKRVGEVEYDLKFPIELVPVHPMFLVSMIKNV